MSCHLPSYLIPSILPNAPRTLLQLFANNRARDEERPMTKRTRKRKNPHFSSHGTVSRDSRMDGASGRSSISGKRFLLPDTSQSAESTSTEEACDDEQNKMLENCNTVKNNGRFPQGPPQYVPICQFNPKLSRSSCRHTQIFFPRVESFE